MMLMLHITCEEHKGEEKVPHKPASVLQLQGVRYMSEQ
jgi:hypothetical protein